MILKNKILFVAPRYHTNQIFATKAFINEGYEVDFHVIEKEFSEDYTYLTPSKIKPSIIYSAIKKIFCLKINHDRFLLIPSLNFIYKYFISSKPGIVIIRNPHYPYSFLYLLMSKIFDGKVLIYSQDPINSKKRNLRQTYYHLLTLIFNIKWISPVKGISNGSKISRNIYYIPIPFKAKENLKVCKNERRINFLMIAKFLEFKRHLLLLVAMKELVNYNVHLTIIGENTKIVHNEVYTKVINYINNNNLGEIVKVITNVPYNKIQGYYLNSDLFILPSTNEVFSISPLEAMGYGVPVIISNSNGFQYNVENGYNGYIFQSDDIGDLTSKLKIFLETKNHEKMKINCLNYVSKNHNLKQYFNNIKELITN